MRKRSKKIIPMHGPVEIENFFAFGSRGLHRVTDGCVVLSTEAHECGWGVRALLDSVCRKMVQYPLVFRHNIVAWEAALDCIDKEMSDAICRREMNGLLCLFGMRIYHENDIGDTLQATLLPPGYDSHDTWKAEHSLILSALRPFVVKGSWFEIQSDSDGEVLRVQWTDKGMIVFARANDWVQVPNALEYEIKIDEAKEQDAAIFPSLSCKASNDVVQ
jgi:hypothetical protein